MICLINIFCTPIVHLTQYSAHSKCSSLCNVNILNKGNVKSGNERESSLKTIKQCANEGSVKMKQVV